MNRTKRKRIQQMRRRRRMISIMLLLFMSLNISVLTHNFSVYAEKPKTYKYYTEIRVERGDTLWEIATEHMTDEYRSPSQYIREVKKINNIGDQIQYGQYLTIPYYSEIKK